MPSPGTRRTIALVGLFVIVFLIGPPSAHAPDPPGESPASSARHCRSRPIRLRNRSRS